MDLTVTDYEILALDAESFVVQHLSALNEEEKKKLRIRLVNSLLKDSDPTTDEKGETWDVLMAELHRVTKASKATEGYKKELTLRIRKALEEHASSSQSKVDTE